MACEPNAPNNTGERFFITRHNNGGRYAVGNHRSERLAREVCGQVYGRNIEKTETLYRSANIYVSIETVHEEKLTYHVADIYVAELKYFKTAFAKKPDKMGYVESTDKIASENNAIIAINGDYCLNNGGIIIRNGQSYKKNRTSSDQFIMYYDGTMKALSPGTFDYEQLMKAGVYQTWAFGPMLLTDGQPMTEFNLPQKNRHQ